MSCRNLAFWRIGRWCFILITLMTVAGCGYGRGPQTGINAVKAMGGQAFPFGGEATDNDVDEVRLSHVKPQSFSGLQDLRRFPKLDALHLDESSIDDTQTHFLQGMQRLTNLNLDGTRVGDPSLDVVGSLTGLEHLRLSSTKVTDDGLQRLAALRSMRKLFLNETMVTDAGLRHLAGFRSLEVLALDGCPILGTGFQRLSSSKIDYLSLNNSDLADLTQISEMKSLYMLKASGCRLGDQSLAPLSEAPRLSFLYLDNNPLTDGCIEHLVRIPNLSLVSLSGTDVTSEGIRLLHESRPKVVVNTKPKKTAN